LREIDDFYKRQWTKKDLHLFVNTAMYKPHKQNVAVSRFVERMRERGIVIEPNERFDFVIVRRNPHAYDIFGRKAELSTGDLYEMPSQLTDDDQIDIDYYMKIIIGQFARMIVFYPDFDVIPKSDSEEDQKAANLKIYDNARNYLFEYAKRYKVQYPDKGSVYKAVAKSALDLVKKSVHRHRGITLKTLDIIGKSRTSIDEEIEARRDLLMKAAENYCNNRLKQSRLTLSALHDIYANKNDGVMRGLIKKYETIINEYLIEFTNIQSSLVHIKQFGEEMQKYVIMLLRQERNLDGVFNREGDAVPTLSSIPVVNAIDKDKVVSEYLDTHLSTKDIDQLRKFAMYMTRYRRLKTTIVYYQCIIRYLNERCQKQAKVFTPKIDLTSMIRDTI
jgi:hypothetical protein